MEKNFVRGYGQFGLYVSQLPPIKGYEYMPPHQRYSLHFKETFIHSWSHEPCADEMNEQIQQWIQGNSNAVDVQERIVEPLLQGIRELVERAVASAFRFRIDRGNEDEFTIDPFRFKREGLGKYRVHVSDEYVDWKYLSSSDIGVFEPANETDMEGFNNFLIELITAMEQSELDRPRQRAERRNRISEIQSAFKGLSNK